MFPDWNRASMLSVHYLIKIYIWFSNTSNSFWAYHLVYYLFFFSFKKNTRQKQRVEWLFALAVTLENICHIYWYEYTTTSNTCTNCVFSFCHPCLPTRGLQLMDYKLQNRCHGSIRGPPFSQTPTKKELYTVQFL